MVNQSGIFVTQLGVSVQRAADYQFVYNSTWPSLACAFDKLVTVGAHATVPLDHNLRFVPLTLGWILQNGVSKGRIFAPSETFQYSPQIDMTMTFDKNNVTLVNSTATDYQVCVKCYNLDITQAVDYTLPNYPAVNAPYNTNAGIKVTKHGKDISSKDLRDFILHSRAQSPALLSTVTGNSNVGGIYYNNPAKYLPWIFAFFDTGGNGIYQGIAPGSQQDGVAFQLGTNLSFTKGTTTITANGAILASTVGNQDLSLVVLRDPLTIANSLEVQY